MWVIWVSEVTLFVGHRLLHGRIGVANYPYLSKKQPMRYQSTTGLPAHVIYEIVTRVHDVAQGRGLDFSRHKIKLYRQVVISLMLLRQNISQMVIADMFGGVPVHDLQDLAQDHRDPGDGAGVHQWRNGGGDRSGTAPAGRRHLRSDREAPSKRAGRCELLRET